MLGVKPPIFLIDPQEVAVPDGRKVHLIGRKPQTVWPNCAKRCENAEAFAQKVLHFSPKVHSFLLKLLLFF